MDDEVPNLKILEGTGFRTLWKWRLAYYRLKDKVEEMQKEWNSWTWQKGFNPNYYSELCTLEEILYGKSVS